MTTTQLENIDSNLLDTVTGGAGPKRGAPGKASSDVDDALGQPAGGGGGEMRPGGGEMRPGGGEMRPGGGGEMRPKY